ncbi:cytochrome c family protein [Rhizorhabdus sp.]|uniref:c-type cytochrome n=1 Tax=Rhizorhabdus sp. TaxID=1968843 RepID=UPI0025E46176|nr:cytochrome c family protein [Rhizorhabdus sp.]
MIACALVMGLATSAAAAPAGDPIAGKSVFAKCAPCHSVIADQNRIGPTLSGIVGGKAGTVTNYAYSPALKASGIIWTMPELDAYLANPRARVPGTRMFFAGLSKAEDRANLIAYLAKPQ